MIAIKERNTVQKMLISSTVKAMSNHPTADEVYEAVVAKCPAISKGTVYRNLNALAESGEVLRIGVANAPDRYDKTAFNHCHFLCMSCGKVYDYDMALRLDDKLTANRDFRVTGYDLLFRGYCRQCDESTESTENTESAESTEAQKAPPMAE